MVEAVLAAYKAARKAQEALYTGVMTVTERQKIKDERSRLVTEKDVAVLEDQPCKLSFEALKPAGQTQTAAGITQTIKLFLAPEVTVRPGSKITVTQDNVTADYQSSGVPAIYPTHQEIMLELFERWA